MLWLARRVPGRGPGVLEFGYGKEQGPLIGAFIFVSSIELVAVHLLLPWETIRLIADILSLWGLLWMVGLLAGVLIHPHLVGPDGIRVRDRWATDLVVPWSAVAGVRARRGGKDGEDGVLTVPILNRTKVDVTLKRADRRRTARCGSSSTTPRGSCGRRVSASRAPSRRRRPRCQCSSCGLNQKPPPTFGLPSFGGSAKPTQLPTVSIQSLGMETVTVWVTAAPSCAPKETLSFESVVKFPSLSRLNAFE